MFAKSVAFVLAGMAGLAISKSAFAGCETIDYYDISYTPWFEHSLLAFATVPPTAALIIDPQRYPIDGIQKVHSDGSVGELIQGTYDETNAPALSLWRPDAPLMDGARYQAVLAEDDWAKELGKVADFTVDDEAAVPAPVGAVLKARRVHSGCAQELAVAVAPWGGDAWFHEVQVGSDLDFTRAWSVALTSDSNAVDMGGASTGKPWIRTRTWVASGEPGQWSEPVRIAGCAHGRSGPRALGVAALLPWVMSRRKKRGRCDGALDLPGRADNRS